MDGYKFPNPVIVPDVQPGRLAPVSHGLRSGSDGNEGEQVAPVPDFRPPFGHHMGFQDGVLPDLDIFADDAVGPDFDSRAQLGFGVDNGGWMDFQLALLPGIAQPFNAMNNQKRRPQKKQ
jgi:hypothetical protein